MPNPIQLLPNGGRAPGARPVSYAEVSSHQALPTSFTDPLYIVFPHDPDHAVAIDNWPVIHGATLPSAGAAVTVLTDDRGNQRIAWWAGTHS